MSIVDSASSTQRAVRLDLPHTKTSSVSAAQIAVKHWGDDAPSKSRSGYFKVKPVFEWCLTFIMICLAMPILVLISLCLLITDGRPIFYRQVRVGRNFKLFHIWKFRTMRRDAEKSTGAVWSSHFDSRVTRIGKWLRATHLDELPQILNVVAGQMHVIGPRPERPEFVKKLLLEIPNYDRRHEVRPGITGLAQVIQGYDSCYNDVAKKVALDVQYIESASLGMDLKIMWFTIPYIAHEIKTAIETRHRKHSPSALVPADAREQLSASQSIDSVSDTPKTLEDQIQSAIREQLADFRRELENAANVPSPKLITKRRDTAINQKSQS